VFGLTSLYCNNNIIIIWRRLDRITTNIAVRIRNIIIHQMFTNLIKKRITYQRYIIILYVPRERNSLISTTCKSFANPQLVSRRKHILHNALIIIGFVF